MYRWKVKGVMCERKENRYQVTRADECKYGLNRTIYQRSWYEERVGVKVGVIVKTELDL